MSLQTQLELPDRWVEQQPMQALLPKELVLLDILLLLLYAMVLENQRDY